MTKTCTKCGESKPRTEFSKDAQKRDGLRSWCKTCANAEHSSWYAANSEKSKIYNAAWYAANSEEHRARTAAWQSVNPEKVRKAIAKWRAANPEAVRIKNQNRRSRNNGGKLSTGLAARLYKLQRGKCACCKKPLGDNYHRDHRMPLALGGSNTDDNIQLLCQRCNNQKGAKHPIDFMQLRGYLL